MTQTMLRRVQPNDVRRERANPVDPGALADASAVVDAVRREGELAVRKEAERFAERGPGESLVLGRDAMRGALDGLDPEDRAALERAADRIRSFAGAQLASLHPLDTPVPGGRAGHTVEPIGAVGCYAPAGRYPLPSSVLMTAAVARAAGCARVVVASPGAHPVMLAAAAIADADEFLAVGGTHAIAALAHGVAGFEPVDKIVGPGNKWVTAAKFLVSGVVGIDMLAGPSELLVIADDSADAELVAADLLAQAEHDIDARAILVTTSPGLAPRVDAALAAQLEALDTRETARAALANGFACVVGSIDEAVEVADAVAPEHLEIMAEDAPGVAAKIRHAGAVFIGALSGEVLGDYGVGPNHTLPTGGTARFRAGLSVFDLVRPRTWIRGDDAQGVRGAMQDTVRIARMEGLSAHAEAARRRLD